MPSKSARISESDLLIPTLRILAAQPNGQMTTSDLIAALEHEFQPAGEDAEILDGRQDTRFTQIVRNMVSHKTAPGNIIAEGLVEYIAPQHALRSTDAGRAYLAKHGG